MTAGALWRVLVVLAAMALSSCASEGPPALDAADVPRRAWLPEAEPKAVILALHGFNDYSNAFAGFGAYAADHGVAVHAYDQRGFGARPGAGLWPGVQVMVSDLRREVERVKAEHPGRPVYLLGESMGAAVVIAAAATGRMPAVDGTILMAPAVWGGDQLNPLYRATLWVAARLAPGWRLTGEGLDILPSDNIEMLRELAADPLVIKGSRVDAIAGLVALMDLALNRAGALQGPLLVLGGARDEIVPPSAHQAMLERLTAAPCDEIVYPEGYHMLLRDLQRRVVWEDILAWIEGEPLPSGLAEPCGGSLTPVAAALP